MIITRFEKDLKLAKDGCEIEVIERRREELKKLYREGASCKNKYKQQCILQEYKRLHAELKIIENLF